MLRCMQEINSPHQDWDWEQGQDRVVSWEEQLWKSILGAQQHKHTPMKVRNREQGGLQLGRLPLWSPGMTPSDPEVLQIKLSDLGSTLYSSPLRTLHCTVQCSIQSSTVILNARPSVFMYVAQSQVPNKSLLSDPQNFNTNTFTHTRTRAPHKQGLFHSLSFPGPCIMSRTQDTL